MCQIVLYIDYFRIRGNKTWLVFIGVYMVTQLKEQTINKTGSKSAD